MAGFASTFPTQEVSQPRIVGGDYTFELATEERRDLELDPRLHALETVATGSPVLALQNRLGGPTTVKQPIYYMFQLAQLRDFIQVDTGGYAVGATTIPIKAGDVALIKQGHHILNARTREILRVNGTPATSMPVRRATGTVAAAAGTAGDELVLLRYAGSEGDTRTTGVLRQPRMIFNYIGEYQDSYEITQYQDASPMMGGGRSRSEAREDKLEQARKAMELKSIFDQRIKFVEGGQMHYVPNGLDAICTENEYDYNGSMSEEKILAASEPIARYGPSTRWVMASPRFMRKINLIFTGERRQNREVIRFAGVNVTSYQAGNLRLNIFPHLLLQDSADTTATGLSGTAYVCNFERGGRAPGFTPVTMRSSKMGYFRWFLNLETDGNRRVIDQLIVNYGFKYTFAEHFARWVNPGS